MIVIKEGSTGYIQVVTKVEGVPVDLTSTQAKIYASDKTTVEDTFTISDPELSRTGIGTYRLEIDTTAAGLDLSAGRYYIELSGIFNTKTYLDREAFEVRFV